ncbi:hypothetical protein KIW84_052374 [Lathyrus oleraceus]|uniref:Uncharacterized protein n=1 Tax=Pisum sativum TaxID=3888 RepID=A0A9D5AET8_PEA|nr:hypothetical protein KIW84_052374 [Pisum sativum]
MEVEYLRKTCVVSYKAMVTGENYKDKKEEEDQTTEGIWEVKRSEEALRIEEKKCGKINCCNPMDLGLIGYKYNWRGPISHGGLRIYERLDRMLSNDQWRLQFPDAQVKVLTRLDFSDHLPLLVSLTDNTSRNFPNYFKFESAWVLEETYNYMVNSSWKANSSLTNNLEELKTQVTKWNMHTVKSVQKEKIS